jgi:uncharacterized protein YndB with AHSA1/START domain
MVEPASAEELFLEVHKHLPAPPELVFKVWTEPSHLVHWFGPEGFSVPEARTDVRPGGKWFTCMRSPSGTEHRVQGVYREIEAPRKVAFTWAWLDEAGQIKHETLVTVTLAPKGTGTDLVLRQTGFANIDMRDRHQEGWASSMDCLAEYLASLPA